MIVIGIGKRIKQAREFLGLTQKELGERIGVTGSAITNYENETSHPKEQILYKLFEALNVDANFLFQDTCKTVKKVLSIEENEVVEAYAKASFKEKNTIRTVLDLPPLESNNAEFSKEFNIQEDMIKTLKELSAMPTAKLTKQK